MSEPHAEIQPELWTDDAPGAVAFYERAFGAVVEHRVDGPAADDLIAQLSVGGARFWVSNTSEQMHRFSPGAIGGTTARMLLVVEGPESLMQRALDAGARETSPVRDEHGWRIGRCVDLFGHEWEIGRPGSG